jgi:hypothetical protein
MLNTCTPPSLVCYVDPHNGELLWGQRILIMHHGAGMMCWLATHVHSAGRMEWIWNGMEWNGMYVLILYWATGEIEWNVVILPVCFIIIFYSLVDPPWMWLASHYVKLKWRKHTRSFSWKAVSDQRGAIGCFETCGHITWATVLKS